MEYKVSAYNYLVSDSNMNLRMYNSLNSTNSLMMVNSTRRDEVLHILNDVNNNKYHNGIIFQELLKKGYICDKNIDETMIANLNKNDIVNFPGLMLTIMPTEDCNFRCKYCYEDHKKGKMSIDVQQSIIKFVKKNIQNYTRLLVGWFGGEPLEALDVVEHLSNELIRICKVAKKNYSAGITTNGYDLTNDTFEKLIRLKVYDYQITIDGLQNTHDRLRVLKDGSGTFSKIISNIEEIKKFKRNIFKVDIRTNFTKEIFDSLDTYLEFYEKVLDDPRFSLFIHMASDWGGEDINTLKDSILSKNSYKKLIKTIADINPNVSFKAHLKDFNSLNCMCYAGIRNSYVIGSDGALYKCTEDFNMEKNKIGYLNTNGDMIIDKYKHSLWLGSCNNQKREACSNCTYYGCCLGGPCPKAKILAENQLNKNVCPRTKGCIEDFLKLFEEELFYQVI